MGATVAVDAVGEDVVGSAVGDAVVGLRLGASEGAVVGLYVYPGAVGASVDGGKLWVGASVGVAVGWRVHVLQCAGHTSRSEGAVHPMVRTRAEQASSSGPESGHDRVGGDVAVGLSVGDAEGV